MNRWFWEYVLVSGWLDFSQNAMNVQRGTLIATLGSFSWRCVETFHGVSQRKTIILLQCLHVLRDLYNTCIWHRVYWAYMQHRSYWFAHLTYIILLHYILIFSYQHFESRGVARNLFWEGINFDQSALSHNDNGFFWKLGQSKYYKYNAPIG